MSLGRHIVFWTGALAVLVGVVWILNDTILPFVLAAAIAYLLNPLVGLLGRIRVSRTAASLLILLLFLVFVTGLAAAFLPLAQRQIADLAAAAPGYIEKLWEMVAPYVDRLQHLFAEGDPSSLPQTLKDNAGNALKMGGGVLSGLASGGQALAGFLATLVLTPIIAFFMMAEWPRMTAWIDQILPRGGYDTIKDILRQIDRKIAGFVRGQITIAFLLGIIYATALSIAGLNFGFLIGLMAGFLSIIPLVGSTFGLVTGLAIAWVQTGSLGYVGVIGAIFVVGQLVEGNFLTPKLLGDSVGLHPLWIMFALLAGGGLLGVVGMLLAVPVAATIGVLAAFAIRRYKASAYYLAPPAAQP